MSVNVVDNNVTVTAVQEVEVANEVVTNTVVNEYPNTISVKSNEFAVVGDGLFATTKEEVPGWMRELVGDLARNATIGAYSAMTGFNSNLYNAMIALQVAENKYQQAINTRITDQEAFVQAVETLNSTVQNSEAEIVSIKQTYATKDFATTTAAQTLEASLNGGAIKSSLGQLASTMTNQYGTMAQRMDVLESTFEDLELGVEGYANATNTLETFVGKNAPGTNAPVIASSKFYQDLNVYLAGTNYTTGGTNTLVNQVTAAATGVESKFAYNSSLKLDGATYDSGFGLATSLTPGSGIPVGSSEFWINADKFKLTTTGYNGVKYSPFSVNGTDGTITFNGKVSFNSVTNVPNFVLPAEVANAINTNTTTIDGSKITTGTIQAGAIAAGAVTADKISADALYGKYVYGATVEGATILGANIVGSVIKSSWLDFNDTGFLTDWQYFTSATVPPAYVNNFAKDVNGQIVVDSSGYVRLPTTGSIGDVKALRSTVYSRGHDEGPNGETVTIPAISTTAVAYDDYTTSSTFRFLKESSKISGGVLIDAYLEGGYGSYDYLTFDTYVKIGYDTYKIYVKIDDYDRWWIIVDKSSSSNGVRNNNFGNVVNWSGEGNVAEVVYNDPTKPFTISAESYGDDAPTNYAGISTLHVKVYMSPDTYVSHSRVSGPLVSIDPIYIFRSDNDPSFSVTCEIPGIVYKSGILILN